MLAGIMISLLLCEQQQNLDDISQINHTLNYYYYAWMIISLAINLFLRKMGFWAGRVLVETSIPAQLAAFGYGSLKLICLNLDLYIQNKEFSPEEVLSFAAVAFVSLSCTSSFLKYLSHSHSGELVSIGYYLWLICYCFPIGITLVNPGVEHRTDNLYALVAACTAICCGGYLHTLHKEEELEDLEDPEDHESLMEI